MGCSNRFLEREFKTVRYELTVTIFNQDRWHGFRMPGRPDLFPPYGREYADPGDGLARGDST
ncbi:MAG TPA: hypothetical protein VFS39_08425 [Nitrospira sp.]|nr:hypothetical protein [Nitrospira sp.]